MRWGFDPPPLTPIVLGEHKGLLSNSSGQRFGQSRRVADASAERFSLTGASVTGGRETASTEM